MASPGAELDPLLAALFARNARGMRYDLSGTKALLALLGHPEDAFASVMVVGTNGKGSTAALIAASLTHAGHRVGLFTSPHLHHFNERVAIDGQHIDDTRCAHWLQRMADLEAAMPRPYSFFEGALCLAAAHFAEQKVDIVVWEAGLGGRLDATNAMPPAKRRAVVITPIALDHQAILGDTLEAIAKEKAAVICPGVPVIVAPQRPAAMAAIAAQATAAAAPTTVVDDDALAASPPLAMPGLAAPLRAPYLRQNAALARAACAALAAGGMACPAQAVASAAAQFAWPGRYQWLKARPWPLRRQPWLLDAGHNPHGCAAFAAALQADPRVRGRRARLLFGALADKPLDAMLAPLLPLVDEVHLVPCPSVRSHPLDALQAALPGGLVHAGVEEALRAMAQPSDGRPSLNLACGSLTLVGAVLAHLQAAPPAP